MTVKDAMATYFARRMATGRPLLAAFEHDDDPRLFVAPPDGDGRVEWRPQPQSDGFDFAGIERRAGATLHPSVKDYYNAFWFMAMGGKVGDGRVTLDPVKPGVGLADLEDKLFGADHGAFRTAGYVAAHGGALRHVPIGLYHPDDLLLVVDNADGAVAVEDHEAGTFRVVAPGLAALIARLA